MIYLLAILVVQMISFAFYAILIFRHKRLFSRKDFLYGIYFVLLFYVPIIVCAKIEDYRLEKEYLSFDSNGDGFFIGDELTPAYYEAERRLISDVGRNFAPITGIVFSILYYPFAVLILWIVSSIANRKNFVKSN